ncbi:MAG TPA: hypothetical protein VJC11_00885 [Patescibacteria group bacterium]|nr:hypothetical protein [Patescibacteria group bacterium]
MLDINLLPKNVRSKKQKEVARIKARAPKSVDIERGQKVNSKILSVNFFGRMWERMSRTKKTDKSVVSGVKPLLQTPPSVTNPSPPPNIGPYPLKPMPIIDRMPDTAKMVEKPAPQQPKAITFARVADGVVIPELSNLIQTIEKEKITPAKLKQVPKPLQPVSPKRDEPTVAPPIPKKIVLKPSDDQRQSSSITLPETAIPSVAGLQPNVTVMPKKVATALIGSPFRFAAAGTLVVLFSASLMGGSYAVFHRLTSALEHVQKTYQDRLQSTSQILGAVNDPVNEVQAAMKESQILYSTYQRWDQNEKRAEEVKKIIEPVLSPFASEVGLQLAGGVVTVHGNLKSDSTVDQALKALQEQKDIAFQALLKKESFDDRFVIQFLTL